ncbi:MAG: MarR family winged helix-turn-helix transcriptional regulator [Pseudomonadota bacterium]
MARENPHHLISRTTGAPCHTEAMGEKDGALPAGQNHLFAVFNEIGIIEQLARHRFEAVLPDGLLLPHFSVLNHLVRLGDDKSLKSLAFAFQVSKGTMTNTVQRLLARGLVEVRPDPKDGRGKRVFLTESGRRMRDDAIAAITPELSTFAAELGEDLFAELLPRLAKIRAKLDYMRNPPSKREA